MNPIGSANGLECLASGLARVEKVSVALGSLQYCYHRTYLLVVYVSTLTSQF
jgi:hypothetical protein